MWIQTDGSNLQDLTLYNADKMSLIMPNATGIGYRLYGQSIGGGNSTGTFFVTSRSKTASQRKALVTKAVNYLLYCLEREANVSHPSPAVCDLTGDISNAPAGL